MTGPFRRLPVSCGVLIACGMLFAATLWREFVAPPDASQSLFPGAPSTLSLTAFPEIYGHFELWNGEWWRALVGAFHHGGVLHLTFNAAGFWVLGELLEPRLGRRRYLWFCLTSALVSMLPELSLGHTPVGISGLIFAQFGLLLVMRSRDEELQLAFGQRVIVLGFLSLLLCVLATTLFQVPIANGAHVVGLLYGLACGWLACELRPHRPRLALLLVVMLHGLVAVWTVAVCRPGWNPRYLAWRAIRSDSLEQWEQVTKLSPGFGLAWIEQARLLDERGERDEAWRTALRGAFHTRSEPRLDEVLRVLWARRGDAIDRARALDDLRRQFGDESDAWLERLRLPAGGPDSEWLSADPPPTDGFAFPDVPVQVPVRLDGIVEIEHDLPGITSPLPPVTAPGTVNPADPHSARYGLLW